MKSAAMNLLSKNEIKFWFGIIAVIVSIVIANQNVVTEIALMKQELTQLTKTSQETNNKFTEVHKETTINTLAITVINTILEID